MQAGAEHHEHDAHLGELAHGVQVAYKTRGKGTYRQTSEQVAHHRRQAHHAGEDATQKGCDEGHDKCGEKNAVLVHGSSERGR